jgi:hypothetical protein
MGELRKVLKENIKQGIPNYFKENSLKYYNLYKSPDNELVKSIPMANIQIGGIYFLYYKDESNWMQLSPILCCDIRDKRLVFAVNLNFLPLEIRLDLFDDLIMNIHNNNDQSKNAVPFNFINFESIYKKLIRKGFEYALVEYEIGRIVKVFKINYDEMPWWIYSQHPKNKYDPIKLYSIWEAKLKNRPERHKELITKLVKDFYNVTDELIDNSNALKGHFQRLQSNQEKFGNKFG